MIGVHPVPSSRALLPPPVHAIQAPNHTRPMSLCIVCYQPYCVVLVGTSEVLCTKNLDQDFGKHPHPLECGIFSNSKILINVISLNVVCNHSHDSGYFLYKLNPRRLGHWAHFSGKKNTESLPHRLELFGQIAIFPSDNACKIDESGGCKPRQSNLS
jgi:hypothetical protein